MALYVYRGFYQDNFQTGKLWNDGTDIFRMLLIKDDPNLNSPSTGLANADMITVSELLTRADVNEVQTLEVSNYLRAAIEAAWRSVTWDPSTDRWRFLASDPIVWPSLAAGATIGAYAIVRGTDANDTQNIVWFADSGATNLPAPTNGQNFSITLNNLGWATNRQPNFGL